MEASMSTGKSIMVTGASGYIGRHVISKLLARGVEVVAVDLINRNIPYGVNVYCGDMLKDSGFIDSLPLCDVLLHLAWQDGFIHNASSHLVNLPFHFDFIKRMAERGVPQIAVMGSMHEVGYWEGAIKEDTPCNPFSMYGIAKNALRQALMVEFKNKSKIFQWLRGFYIYGDDHFNNSIFTKLLEAAEAGKNLFPFTNGKNKYDFLHVEELAQRIVSTVMQGRVDGIINCCSGIPLSLGEAVENFIKSHGLNIKLDYGAFPDRPYDSPGVWGDATKINRILEMESHG